MYSMVLFSLKICLYTYILIEKNSMWRSPSLPALLISFNSRNRSPYNFVPF